MGLTILDPDERGAVTIPARQRPSVVGTAADRAVAADAELAEMGQDEVLAGIDRLRQERGAMVLAHNYEAGAIQDLADVVGDSLELARRAAASDAELIVVCGVHFMAETASILCPDKVVLTPEPDAGCSLAASVTAPEILEWKRAHPDGVVVSYVNTTAEVKAVSDLCCTSSNATNVVASIDPDADVLFLPDTALGLHVERATGRRLHLWLGECHVHAAISYDDVAERARRHPGAELLIHPECRCAGDCLRAVEDGSLPIRGLTVASTGGMVAHARGNESEVALVATEVGMLHRLRKESERTRFVAVRDDAICEYMKAITPAKLYRTLRDLEYPVEVPPGIAEPARRALEAMVAVSP
jgi:quinolinate synthase